jgi:hypothetical protein
MVKQFTVGSKWDYTPFFKTYPRTLTLIEITEDSIVFKDNKGKYTVGVDIPLIEINEDLLVLKSSNGVDQKWERRK